MRVWIETRLLRRGASHRPVTLYVRVWIETATTNGLLHRRYSVTLYVRVWIETLTLIM